MAQKTVLYISNEIPFPAKPCYQTHDYLHPISATFHKGLQIFHQIGFWPLTSSTQLVTFCRSSPVLRHPNNELWKEQRVQLWMEEHDLSDAVVETYEQHLDHAMAGLQVGLGHFIIGARQSHRLLWKASRRERIFSSAEHLSSSLQL